MEYFMGDWLYEKNSLLDFYAFSSTTERLITCIAKSDLKEAHQSDT
jgi:hypothetical protein